MSQGGALQPQIQAALMGQYPMGQQTAGGPQMAPGMQQSLQGNQATVQQPGSGPQQQGYAMPQGQGSWMPQGGQQPGYMDLMRSLMTNPAAFTGGGFGQTLAANPQGGVSPQAAALASWQPPTPAPQAAANPIPAFVAQQQAAQAATQQAAAQPPPPPVDPGGGNGGAE